MKTKIAWSVLMIAFSFQAFAQDVTIIQQNAGTNTQSYSSSNTKIKKPRFWIGPKFGSDYLGIPLSTDALMDPLKQQNWQAGLMMQFGRTLYLQPEAYYSVTTTTDQLNNTTSSTAIKIPAMLGLRFLNLGLFSLHIMGGPQFTLPMNNDDDGLTGEKYMDIMIGAGIDVLGFITADVRYIYDPDIKVADHIKNFDYTATPFNITVGLKLR